MFLLLNTFLESGMTSVSLTQNYCTAICYTIFFYRKMAIVNFLYTSLSNIFTPHPLSHSRSYRQTNMIPKPMTVSSGSSASTFWVTAFGTNENRQSGENSPDCLLLIACRFIAGYLYRKRLMLILGVFSKGSDTNSTFVILL